MTSFWQTLFLGNAVKDWIISLGVILLALSISWIVQKVILKRVQLFAKKTDSTLDDFAVKLTQKSIMPFLFILSFYFGLQQLKFPAQFDRFFHTAMLAATIFFVIRIISGILAYVFEQFAAKEDKKNVSLAKQTKGILLIVRITFWILGFIFLVDNLGYDITTIITGLGIGGIAMH
jgi:small-conductance mechanosensitive channel